MTAEQKIAYFSMRALQSSLLFGALVFFALMVFFYFMPQPETENMRAITLVPNFLIGLFLVAPNRYFFEKAPKPELYSRIRWIGFWLLAAYCAGRAVWYWTQMWWTSPDHFETVAMYYLLLGISLPLSLWLRQAGRIPAGSVAK